MGRMVSPSAARRRGGHAAMPQTTKDPIAAAAAVIQSLQQVVSRRVDPVMGGVISVTVVATGFPE